MTESTHPDRPEADCSECSTEDEQEDSSSTVGTPVEEKCLRELAKSVVVWVLLLMSTWVANKILDNVVEEALEDVLEAVGIIKDSERTDSDAQCLEEFIEMISNIVADGGWRHANDSEQNILRSRTIAAMACAAAAEKRQVVELLASIGALDNVDPTRFPPMNVEGIDLSGTDLTDVDLARKSLASATLDSANLLRADLQDADLKGIQGTDVDFGCAIANDVDLSNAILIAPNFADANLESADLTGARLLDGAFDGTNLCNAIVTGVQGIRFTQEQLSCNNNARSQPARAPCQPASVTEEEADARSSEFVVGVITLLVLLIGAIVCGRRR